MCHTKFGKRLLHPVRCQSRYIPSPRDGRCQVSDDGAPVKNPSSKANRSIVVAQAIAHQLFLNTTSPLAVGTFGTRQINLMLCIRYHSIRNESYWKLSCCLLRAFEYWHGHGSECNPRRHSSVRYRISLPALANVPLMATVDMRRQNTSVLSIW